MGYVGKSVGYIGKNVGYAAITHTFQPMKSIRSDEIWCMSVVCQINCAGGITRTKHVHAQSQVLGC